MKWKVLSSNYLHNNQWLKIRKEVCETPSGKIVDPYYIYDFPEWVAAVALTEDGNVVMIRQYRHALGDISIELPGGCVDDTDKDFEEAIARELMEETGYRFSSYEYLGKISANSSTNSNFLHMFLAKGGKLIAEQSLDENEDIEVMVMPMAELKKLVRENVITQSMHIACILYALESIGELKYY